MTSNYCTFGLLTVVYHDSNNDSTRWYGVSSIIGFLNQQTVRLLSCGQLPGLVTQPGKTVARPVDVSEPQSTAIRPEAKTRVQESESHPQVVTTCRPAVSGTEGI